jgi:hypothetical protein
MRFLAIFCLSITASAQSEFSEPKATARVTAGVSDVVVPLKITPTPAGQDLLFITVDIEGVGIQLELPDGHRVTRENAHSFSFEWQVFNQTQGQGILDAEMLRKVNYMIEIPAGAPAGTWRIHANASKLTRTATIRAFFLPLNGGQAIGATIEAEPATRGAHYSGETQELIATVSDYGSPMGDAILTAVGARVDPEYRGKVVQGTPIALTPRADGSFSLELPWREAGTYRVTFHAEGKGRNGQRYSTEMSMSAYITQRLVKLVNIADQGVDEEGNGKIDRINVAVRAEVVIPNRYFVVIKMITRSGKDLYSSQTADLGSGEKVLTASFDRKDMLRLDQDGPYTISAEIAGISGQGLMGMPIEKITAESTAYERSTFDFAPIFFIRSRAMPLSTNGAPPFTGFALSFDVFSPGGNCEWYTSLEGEGIASAVKRGHGALRAGLSEMWVSFDNDEMLKLEDVPLKIGPTHLGCGNLEAFFKGPYTLPLFPHGTFLRVSPSLNINTNQEEITLPRGKGADLHFFVEAKGGFDEPIEVAIEGLPAGVTTRELPAPVPVRNLSTYHYPLFADPGVPAGRYELKVRVRTKTTEHTLVFTLLVT